MCSFDPHQMTSVLANVRPQWLLIYESIVSGLTSKEDPCYRTSLEHLPFILQADSIRAMLLIESPLGIFKMSH
ncbi:hypothetical protein HCUR_00085 [Holospora curviuscula]|uniref:Uncharacterized protein n=1 Tax=Holospora curviuscula TaxID=1082868 RepID=A0A2S5RI23_9PROT|nr:hypothetical protein HCUR_00085 [Holospora curviuscula]